MDPNGLGARLLSTFFEELAEHVQAFNRDALALEKDPSGEAAAERLTSLLRSAHSLKGAARAVNADPIEAACHRLEEVLSAAQRGRQPIGADLPALLLAAADAFEDAGARLRANRDLAGAPIESLLAAPVEPAATSASRSEVTPRPDIPPAPAGTVVRVPAERLDALLTRSGELLVACRRLEDRPQEVATVRDAVGACRAEWRAAERALRAARHPGGDAEPTSGLVARRLRRMGERLRRLEHDLERLTAAVSVDVRQLQDAAGPLGHDVREMRMLPFAHACEGLERMVRDLARAGGREADVCVYGGGVGLDRSILEGLKDPLRHLVRNALDHGIEAPADRRAAGKPVRGRITVTAALRGAQVEVVIGDDGRGIDLDGLRERARERGLPETASEPELLALAFEPGVSTARVVTDVSGRGVGLDVVRSRLAALHGRADVSSVAGRGTRFVLQVPLTLTTLRAVLATAGGQVFAFPGTNVAGLMRVTPEDLRSVGGRRTLVFAGVATALLPLAEVLGLPRTPAPHGPQLPAVLVAAGEKQVAFLVDEVLAEQEITVKRLPDRVHSGRTLLSGATILPSGRVALVLNLAPLVASAVAGASGNRVVPFLPAPADVVRKRILLVDDSITTRTLVKTVLEAAGYDVTAAADGHLAWTLLQEAGADMIVSDVEMPRMDGIALTESVRASDRFRELPVVLVTGRENEWDRARGMKAGADAYLLKSAFDQERFLATIAQLLGSDG